MRSTHYPLVKIGAKRPWMSERGISLFPETYGRRRCISSVIPTMPIPITYTQTVRGGAATWARAWWSWQELEFDQKKTMDAAHDAA